MNELKYVFENELIDMFEETKANYIKVNRN